jgi:hypothetical protein
VPISPQHSFCIVSTDLDAWVSAPVIGSSVDQVKPVHQLDAGATCSSGMTQVSMQLGASQGFLVAYDTRVPPLEDLSLFFALGFGLAFGVTRIVSYTLGRVILLIRGAL